MRRTCGRRWYLTSFGMLLTMCLAGCSGAETDGRDTESNGSSTATVVPSTQTETTSGESTDRPTEKPTTDTTTSAPTEGGVSAGESYSFEGDGTSTTNEVTFRGGVITVDYSHEGERNFIVEALAVEGDSLDDTILVNQVGTVDAGTAARIGNGPYRLNVDASGPWTLSITEPGASGAENSPVETSGTGEQYVGPYRFDGVTSVQARHSGQRNFIVEAYAVNGGLLDDVILFNEVGSFQGSVSERLRGTYFISVTADGDWVLSFE